MIPHLNGASMVPPKEKEREMSKVTAVALTTALMMTVCGCETTPRIAPEPDVCEFICMQYLSGGEWFCDSDCDGWYDAVEIEFGYNPCSPLSPPVAPSSPATVCADVLDADVILIFSKAQQSDPTEVYEAQRNELENP